MLRRLLLALLLLWPTLAFGGSPTLAILYFDHQGSEELAPLGVGLAQMLITDLHGTEGVTVVERERLQAILDELDLGHSGRVDQETAARIGRLLGAQWMLFGTSIDVLGTLRIDVRLTEVETSRQLMATGVDGAPADFLELRRELAGELQTWLLAQAEGPEGRRAPPAEQAPPTERTGTRAGTGAAPDTQAPPPTVAPDADALRAAVAFSEGLIHLDRQDLPRAREAFQAAVAADARLEAARAELERLEL